MIKKSLSDSFLFAPGDILHCGKIKISIMETETILMGIRFIMMIRASADRVIIARVWSIHFIYFILGIVQISNRSENYDIDFYTKGHFSERNQEECPFCAF